MQAGTRIKQGRGVDWRLPAVPQGTPRLAVSLLLLLFVWLWSPIRMGVVVGDSMAPTYNAGDKFLMSRVRRAPGYGEVVVFERAGELYLKRVWATAGQEIWAVRWKNGQGSPDLLLSSDQAPGMRAFLRRHPGIGVLTHTTVPKQHIYVVGDGVTSEDSRTFGSIPLTALRGVVVAPHREAAIHSFAGVSPRQ